MEPWKILCMMKGIDMARHKEKEKKAKLVKMRISEKDYEELENAVKKSGMTKTDIMLNGIKVYCKMLEYQD